MSPADSMRSMNRRRISHGNVPSPSQTTTTRSAGPGVNEFSYGVASGMRTVSTTPAPLSSWNHVSSVTS